MKGGAAAWAQRAGAALALSALAGVGAGVTSAIFLQGLAWVTQLRVDHRSLIWALPFAGAALGWILERWGSPIRGGNNLLLDTVHEGGGQLPRRMVPFVLGGTLVTHLFGGSAGREGAAVQMAGSLADALAHRVRATPHLRRALLVAGIAGGFGSVFGTPVAGAIFGLEVLTVGRLEWIAWAPCLIASFVGDFVTRHLGITHTPYPQLLELPASWLVLGKWTLFAVAVAGVSSAAVEAIHRSKRVLESIFPRLPLRLAAGGILVVGAWRWLGTDDYLGLGIPTILRAFEDPHLPRDAFLLKVLLTAVTLGAGFLGGEVTPLFFVGAALGNVLGRWLQLPLGMATGVGLAAVFATAANTPLALSVMAAELMGLHVLPYALWVSGLAYALTGHRGLYGGQRVRRASPPGAPPVHFRLEEIRRSRK